MIASNTYHRPKTLGELRTKLQEGIACEVVAYVAEMTAIMLRGWMTFATFTIRQSENEGWVVFEDSDEER